MTQFDPGIEAYVEALAEATRGWPVPDGPAENRRHAERVAAHFRVPRPPGLSITDDVLCVEGRELPVRTYRPAGLAGSGPHPTSFYFHGGGWVHGSIETHDGIAADIADLSGTQVLSLNYRRAPENPYPAALDDCRVCVAAATAPGSLFDADPERFALVGDSAGGNLAVCTALANRDHGGPAARALLLFYPVLGSDLDTESYLNAPDPVLGRETMRYFLEAYLGGDLGAGDQYAIPMRAADLSALPPTRILAAALDPLRDEALAFGARLAAAGVETDCRELPGLIHAFLRVRRDSALIAAELRAACEDLGARLRG